MRFLGFFIPIAAVVGVYVAFEAIHKQQESAAEGQRARDDSEERELEEEMKAQEQEFDRILNSALRRPTQVRKDTERLAKLLENVMATQRRMHARMRKLSQRCDRLQDRLVNELAYRENLIQQLQERSEELAVAQDRVAAFEGQLELARRGAGVAAGPQINLA